MPVMSRRSTLGALCDLLADLYPSKEDSWRIVDRASLSSKRIQFRDSAVDNWHEILLEADRRHRVVALVEVAKQQYSERSTELEAALGIYQAAPRERFTDRVREIVRILRYGRREQVLAAAGLLLLTAPQLLKLVPDLPALPGWLTLTLSLAGAACLTWCVWVIWRQTVPPPAAPAAAKPSAIKGAGSFGPQDGELFLRLGRNRELARLHGWVLDDQVPLVVLLGESGVGKTSLVRSGLPEHLRSEEVPVIYWEALPGDPEKGLLHAVRSQWPEGATAPESLGELVDGEGAPRAVLVIDQLEQLSPEKHPGIFALLRQAICAEPPYSAILVVAGGGVPAGVPAGVAGLRARRVAGRRPAAGGEAVAEALLGGGGGEGAGGAGGGERARDRAEGVDGAARRHHRRRDGVAGGRRHQSVDPERARRQRGGTVGVLGR